MQYISLDGVFQEYSEKLKIWGKYNEYPCGFRRWSVRDQTDCGWEIFLAPQTSQRLRSDENLVTTSTDQMLIKLSQTKRSIMNTGGNGGLGKCTDNKQLKYFGENHYHRKLCEAEEAIDVYNQYCQCHPFGSLYHLEPRLSRIMKNGVYTEVTEPDANGNLTSYRYCSINQMATCIPAQWTRNSRRLNAKNLRAKCHAPCDSTSLSISSNSIGGKLEAHQFFPNYSKADDIDLLRVFIYFGSVQELESKQVEGIKFLDLLSKVGAAFSLWLGFKFMTILQLFYYIFWWGKRKKNGTQSQSFNNGNDHQHNPNIKSVHAWN